MIRNFEMERQRIEKLVESKGDIFKENIVSVYSIKQWLIESIEQLVKTQNEIEKVAYEWQNSQEKFISAA